MNKRYKIRKAKVLKNGKTAGYLISNKRRFAFLYDRDYISNGGASIAINLPKTKRIFTSNHLFPYFSGLLPEGESKKFICNNLGIDSKDSFSMLLELAQNETIGDITVQEIK